MTYPLVEVGELMSRRNGSVDPAKFPDEEFELHSIPAFDAGRPEFLIGSQIGSSKQIVQPDDVMISKIVPHIRRASVVGAASGKRQIASGEWIVFRSERFIPRYLRHVLISDEFNGKFMATVSGVGGSLLRARPAEVAKIKIPLPSFAEQRRVAAILDKADALRAKRREAIAKLDQLLRSVFQEMFGDPVTNPMGWRFVACHELCGSPDDIKCGPFGTQLAKEEFQSEGIPLWGIKHVNADFKRPTHEFLSQQKAKDLAQYSIEPGDLVMTRKGTVGNCAVYPGGMPSGVMHSDLLRFRVDLDVCNPVFLRDQLRFSQLVARQVEVMSSGAIMAGINVSKLKNLTVFYPDIKHQNRYAEIVSRGVGCVADSWSRSLSAAERLFNSLQHQAFSGAL